MLLSKIHKVFKALKMYSYGHAIITLWSFFTIFVMFYIYLHTVVLYTELYLSPERDTLWFNMFNHLLTLNMDLTIVYAIYLLKMIRFNVETWLRELEKYAIRWFGTVSDGDAELNIFLELYITIIETYNLYKRIFQEVVRILINPC